MKQLSITSNSTCSTTSACSEEEGPFSSSSFSSLDHEQEPQQSKPRQRRFSLLAQVKKTLRKSLKKHGISSDKTVEDGNKNNTDGRNLRKGRRRRQEQTSLVSFSLRNQVYEPYLPDSTTSSQEDWDVRHPETYERLWYSPNDIKAMKRNARESFQSYRESLEQVQVVGDAHEQHPNKDLHQTADQDQYGEEGGHFGSQMQRLFQDCAILASIQCSPEAMRESPEEIALADQEAIEELMEKHGPFLEHAYSSTRGMERLANLTLRRFRSYHVQCLLAHQTDLRNALPPSALLLPRSEERAEQLREQGLSTSRAATVMAQVLAQMDYQEATLGTKDFTEFKEEHHAYE